MEIFGHKSKKSTNYELIIVLDNGITKVITVHPKGGMNMCQHTIQGNPAYHITLKNNSVNLVLMLEEKSADYQGQHDSSLWTMNA